jgi:predicted RNA-binding protein YlqC (UPF0109 family)
VPNQPTPLENYSTNKMKQLIEYIVSNIVNHPESVVITETATEDKDTAKYLIQVDPEDVGRVIGKQGKVIKSIRQIVRIAAIQKGTRAIVDLLEEGGSVQEENSTPSVESEEVEPVAQTEEIKEEESAE